MQIAQIGDLPCAGERLLVGLPIIEAPAVGRSVRAEQTGVVDGRCDQRDVALLRQWQQLVRRRLVEKRVSAGDHHDVDVAAADEFRQHRGLVDTRSDRADNALVAKFDER